MKKFTDLYSIPSAIIMYVFIFSNLEVLFDVNLQTVLSLLLIDLIASFFIPLTDNIFIKNNAQFELIFPFINYDKIKNLNNKQKENFFHALLTFPKLRLNFLLKVSIVKIIPVALVILFFYQKDIPFYLKLIKYIIFQLMILTAWYNLTFLELHQYTSKKIKEFHEKFDWSSIFGNSTSFYNKTESLKYEQNGLMALGLCFFWTILSADFTPSQDSLIPNQKLFIFLSSCALGFSRIYLLNRRFLFKNLNDISHFFDHFDFKNISNFIFPLHSFGHLTKFQHTLNKIGFELRKNQGELYHLIAVETERARFRAIGEVSGLIVHDLAGPINNIKFCYEEIHNKLQSHPTSLQRTSSYLDHLNLNLQHSIELINSMRAILKNPNKIETSNFYECYQYVSELIKIYMKTNSKGIVQLKLENSNCHCQILIARVNLITILYNLFKNAIDSFEFKKESSNFIISVKLNYIKKHKKDFIEITISDNGKGLSQSEFIRLTKETGLLDRDIFFRQGLGLRLTCFLAERHGGAVEYIRLHNSKFTTSLRIKLPVKKLDSLDTELKTKQKCSIADVV